MAKLYKLHPTNPQPRRIEEIRDALRQGAIMLYPTDTVYAIGCDLNAKTAIQRVRQIKQLSNDKPLTFLCSSLSDAAHYAHISNPNYRLIKSLAPGPYTFLLPATKLVPKLVMNPKRKTAGIRVPNNPICQNLLEQLGNPIISTSAHLPEITPTPTPRSGRKGRISAPTASPDPSHGSPYHMEAEELFNQLDSCVDLIIGLDHAEPHLLSTDPTYNVSTILDLTEDNPTVVRQGLGWAALKDWDLPQSA